MIENIEALCGDSKFCALAKGDVAKEVDIDAVRNAGTAQHIAALVSERPERGERECRRIEIAKDIAGYV